MARQRLRPVWPPAVLDALYHEVHDCHGWLDHRLRVPVTGQLAQWMTAECGLRSAADLSCGEGSALDMVNLPAEARFYGDLVPGHPYCGPIEKTLYEIPPVGLLICGETIEHLDDPDTFLVGARSRVSCLVVSTPVGSWNDSTPGHYWAWDRPEVEAMLGRAGFTVHVYLELGWPGDPRLPHTFGIWGCR
jgi:hypothetical protein